MKKQDLKAELEPLVNELPDDISSTSQPRPDFHRLILRILKIILDFLTD